MIRIIGVKIIDRIKESGLTQKVLSRYGESIITRLGFHEVTESVCSREACIVLHLRSDDQQAGLLKSELEGIGGVIVREMNFGEERHDPGTDGSRCAEVLGLLVEKDPDTIVTVQKILTSFGCNIRTRLGVNETFFGEPAGLIILELSGDHDQRSLLEQHLCDVKKIRLGRLVF